MADVGSAPDPQDARSPEEFVARLQALKDWSRLTYRELAARADALGDVLPRSTVANMLARSTLPREELVAAFVRACGVGPAELTVWLSVRKNLAIRAEPGGGSLPGPDRAASGPGEESAPARADEPVPPGGRPVSSGREPVSSGRAEPSPPGDGERPRPGRPSRRVLTLCAALGLAALVTAAAVVWWRADDGGRGPDKGTAGSTGPAGPSSGTRTAQPPAAAPEPGRYRIRVVHSSLCLSERPKETTAWVYQAPCDDVFPAFFLKRLDGGRWRIATEHPQHGPGCSGIIGTSKAQGAPLSDDYCDSRGSAERFRLEPVDRPAQGYRLRPVHTDLCLGLPGGTTERWTRVVQQRCRSGEPGQVFRFDPVKSGAER